MSGPSEVLGDDDDWALPDLTERSVVPNLIAVPRLRFIVYREAGKSVERVVDQEGDRLRIGSHPRNDLVLHDRRVSRFHCVLSLEEGAWRITDTGALNGTTLSGVRVRDAILPRANCELTLGDSGLRIVQLQPEKLRPIPELARFGELRGSGLAMREVFSLLERVATTDATVLLSGESGTGKDLVANEIVRRSRRAGRPLITIDCSSISAKAIESELFGRGQSALAGPDQPRIGAFEVADQGTLFLDKIGELPLEIQPKLLRALETGEIRRVGETQTRKIDVRVIAATDHDIERKVNRGRFREDLYSRLSVFVVRLPPLRERPQDISELVSVFLERMGATELSWLFTPEVYRDLEKHDWPGNVRELRNYVERAIVLQEVGSAAANGASRSGAETSSSGPASDDVDLTGPFKVVKERLISQFEGAYLERLMTAAAGNVSLASRMARLDRMYLYRLLQRHGIAREAGTPDASMRRHLER